MTKSPPWILGLSPYVPGKPASEVERELGVTDVLKLASNESPWGAAPGARAALRASAEALEIYPDPNCHGLRTALAARLRAEPSDIVVGNGSNELITLLCRAFAMPGDTVVAPAHAFIAYKLGAQSVGAQLIEVPAPDLRADVDALIAACTGETRLLFVANPNNPTGTHIDAAELTRLLVGVPAHVLVVIDEAYFEYRDPAAVPDALSLRATRQNLAVLRTFSKAYGLAALRVGYGVFPGYVAETLNRVRDPFNVSAVAQAAAEAALADGDHVARVRVEVAGARALLRGDLEALGLRVWPSQANFVLHDLPVASAAVHAGLLRAGVIVRPLAPYGLHRQLRVTVGTVAECGRYVAALTRVLTEVGP